MLVELGPTFLISRIYYCRLAPHPNSVDRIVLYLGDYQHSRGWRQGPCTMLASYVFEGHRALRANRGRSERHAMRVNMNTSRTGFIIVSTTYVSTDHKTTIFVQLQM